MLLDSDIIIDLYDFNLLLNYVPLQRSQGHGPENAQQLKGTQGHSKPHGGRAFYKKQREIGFGVFTDTHIEEIPIDVSFSV